MEPEPRWGNSPIDLSAHDLPALKVNFLLGHLPPTGTLLELGAGEGKVLRTVRRERPGLRLIGCDVRNVPPSDAAYEFRRVEGSVPAAPAELDVALFVDVLEHVDDPRLILRELHRALRPGGLLLGFIPLEGEPRSAYALYRTLLGADLYRDTKEHVQSFSRKDALGLLADFELLEQRHAYHLLGQTLDATFFALARLPRLKRFWWTENRYYAAKAGQSGYFARAMNVALGVGNSLSFIESRLLSRVPWFSAGLLFAARRP
jgi:SAM-dependent methyltransferase